MFAPVTAVGLIATNRVSLFVLENPGFGWGFLLAEWLVAATINSVLA